MFESLDKKVSGIESMFAQQDEQDQQLKAQQAYLQKAMPLMDGLFKTRLQSGYPLIVSRSLSYTTSIIPGSEENDNFYAKSTSAADAESRAPSFQFSQVTLPVGTQLFFKSLDPHMQEFVFNDQNGREHGIPFVEQNTLLFNTDVFTTVQQFLANQEK